MSEIEQALKRIETKIKKLETERKSFGMGEKIFQKYKKEFLSIYPKVSDEACKSNIGLMLQGEKVKTYPCFLKINDFCEIEEITECFDGIRPILYETPAQPRLRQMQEDMIIPYCNYSAMHKAYEKITTL